MTVLNGGVVAAGAVSQQFPECSVVLVCGNECLDFHHTLMFVFLAFEEHQYLSQREEEDISLNSALTLKCLILELCTQVQLRSWEETRATDFKKRCRRHACGPVCDSALSPAWWGLFMSKVAVAVGKLSIASVSVCVIQSPTSFMLHLK